MRHGIGEHTNVPAFAGSRKPRNRDGHAFSAQGIYLPALRRSVPTKVARVLADDRRLKGRLICDSLRCCPRGAESMLASKGRPHAVRARARDLQELAEIPHPAWRLNQVAKQTASAYVTATKANEVLATRELSNRIKTDGFTALEQVAEFLRARSPVAPEPCATRSRFSRRRGRRAMPNPVMLFHNGDLRTALEEHDNGIGQEVEAAPERHVLQADEIEWAKALAARYNVDAPVLREDDIWMDEPQPVQVDV